MPLPLPRLASILLGLHYLYRCRIIYYNLKPKNLFIDKDKDKITVIIANFSLFKIVTPINNLLNTFYGTLLYTTPDVFPGRTCISNGYRAKVDIYIYSLLEVPPLPKKKDPKLNYKDENNNKLCLETGYCNSLFKKTYNSRIVNTDIDDIVDNRIGINKATFIARNLWGYLERGYYNSLFRKTYNSYIIGVNNIGGSINSNRVGLINLLLIIKGFISGALARQLMTLTSIGLSWSLTIGLSNSNLNSGFNLDSRSRHKGGPIAGLFIRRDCFTNSLKSRQFSNNAAKK
ncbi:kinase-like protein [Cenococcum geophilum]